MVFGRKTLSDTEKGQDIYGVELNSIEHDFRDEIAKYIAETVQEQIEQIKLLIPQQATQDNQLADKEFVNSSVATNTSNFIGTFNTLEELESKTATNNDYAFWKTTDSDGNVLFKRYKYVADDETWQFEYDLNNSSFTAEQWSAINSGITEDKVNKMVSIDTVYPVGSLYWTSKSPEEGGDPNELFYGTTWVRVKDTFIWAKGDDTTIGAGGGSYSVTLSSNNLPKHQHGLNGHTHTINHDHASFTSSNAGTHIHSLLAYSGGKKGISNVYGGSIPASNVATKDDHTYSVYPDYGGISYSSYIGSAGSHRHDIDVPNYTGTSGGNSGNTTDGGFSNSAFSIMPPYTSKYCWERTE